MGSDAITESLFRTLYDEWFEAIRTHDRAWFERTLADEFLYVHFEGGFFDKQALIDLDMSISEAELAVRELSVEGLAADVALVVGRYYARETVIAEADVSEGMRALEAGIELRWSAVWVRRADRWQARLHHDTIIR